MKRSKRDTGLILGLLVLILALAAGLRFYALAGQSLWSDEGNSAALATRSFLQIARDAANDIHPPLYYWLLRLWTLAFGASEVGLRSLSAALGVGLVLVIFELGQRIFNRTTGLGAAFIAAIAPFQVYYGQEARMYMLLALETALAAALFWWLVSQEDDRLPAAGGAPAAHCRWLPFSGSLLVLVLAAGLYTHYAFALIIGLLCVLYLAWLIASWRRGLAGRRLLRWGLILALTLGFYAPWLPTAIRQLTVWPGGSVTANLVTQLRVLLATLGLGPVAREQAGGWWMGVLPALALLGTLPWPLSDRRGQIGGTRLDWLRGVLPIAWVVAPMVMIMAFGLYREAYLKFLLIASPAYALLLARAALGPIGSLLAPAEDTARTRVPPVGPAMGRGVLGVVWAVLALAAVGGFSGATLARYYTDATVARDDYRGIVQFIEATAGADDVIVLNAPGQIEVFQYYYHGDQPIFALPRQRPLDLEATMADLTQLLEHNKVYAIYWAADEADPLHVIQNWLDSRGYKTLDQWRGNVRLAVYVMPERRQPDEVMDDLNVRLGTDISLLGYRGWNLAPAAGEVTQLQLIWRAEQQPTQRSKVFLQLLDERDQVIAQRDAEPAGEGHPTNTWLSGEVILDNHGLLIPPGTPPGTYRRIVGMYNPETLERLKLPDGSDFISLPPITVARAKTPPPLAALNMEYNQPFDFGGITLLGHDRYKRGFGHAPETPIYPGDLLHVTFYWQANVTPRATWWFDLTLNDSTGHTVASMQAPLVSETYGTTLWQEREIVRGEHDLTIPPELPPDTYRLSLIMQPDSKTPAGTAYLGTVKILGPEEK